MITVNITTTNFSVAATDVVNNITVSADNSVFTVTNQVSNFTVTSVTPVISFQAEGAGFDFTQKFRGTWISGQDYNRNDIVEYAYSIYICQIPAQNTLTSSTPPPQDPTSWELFIFNEWPRAYLTITTTATVGGPISIGSTATIGGPATIGGTITVNGVGTSTINGPLELNSNLTVDGTTNLNSNVNINGNLAINGNISLNRLTASTGTFTSKLQVGQGTTTGTFYINGQKYPHDAGIYGQVLYTNGTDTAAWVNLGELQNWSLTEDLYTNGFNIVSGNPNNQITITNGTTPNQGASIQLSRAVTTDVIDFDSDEINLNSVVFANDDIRTNGYLTGATNTQPTRIGQGGVRFFDGTVQTTAVTNTGTFTLAQIASDVRLGVVRIGEYLLIDPATGVLTVDTASLPVNYSLPAASTSTRGGIRVGQGLGITDTDVLFVSTSTAPSGKISLTENMATNGFLIMNSTSTVDTDFIDVNEDGINIKSAEIVIQSNAAGGNPANFKIYNNTATMTVGTASVAVSNGLIDLVAGVVRVGRDINNSKIQAATYYDYAGTGPAYFPANIQFSDQTIQRTAWRGYDQGLI